MPSEGPLKSSERSRTEASAQVHIRVAHSPDSDDAFMFFALAMNKIDTGRFRFTHHLEDIESLNRKALRGEFEVTAVSIHAYAYIADKYLLLSSGASMGEGYGPMVVARKDWSVDDLRGKTIAVPGSMTTAYLVMRLCLGEFSHAVLPFDQIMAAVRTGEVEAGLIIHEGQITYAQQGLHRVVDLGAWWQQQTGLPLPLGGNAVRRNLGEGTIREIARLLREGIQYALDHRDEALDHAMTFARDLKPAEADRFVRMYVNRRTLDYGEDGRRAVSLLLDEAYKARVIPAPVVPEFTP